MPKTNDAYFCRDVLPRLSADECGASVRQADGCHHYSVICSDETDSLDPSPNTVMIARNVVPYIRHVSPSTRRTAIGCN